MILDHLTSPSENGLSRRGFLRVGAAAGGGLMLSLSLPFANGQAESRDADKFVPNAFIRIDGDGRIVLTMPYVEMGQGTYTSIPMLIAEELEVDLKSGAAGTCSAERKALRQPFVRRAGNRRLDRDTRGLAAPAPSRCNCQDHAGGSCGKTLECRSGVLPSAKR